MSMSVIYSAGSNAPVDVEELPIKGLRWASRWRMNNGQPDSFVVPFPTNLPANLVYHGQSRFDYGHYGIHLGQEDRLTFLGSASTVIRADFVDCRAGSETLHRRFSTTFAPGSHRTLLIPPGVAHTFYGLEGVYTINEYGLFLPDPRAWADGKVAWQPGNDIVNIPLDIPDDRLPVFQPNQHPASEAFYAAMLRRQEEAIPDLTTEFPMARDMAVDGKNLRVALKARVAARTDALPEWEAIPGIEGLGWQRHIAVATGEHSGIVPMPGPQAFYVVDHGEAGFAHDSYGIHLGQQDRLTFVGPTNHEVMVRLLDCRSGSPTLHHKMDHVFRPDPRRFLVIPPGVAHAFVGLETVFTINRSRVFTKEDGTYRPGSDVIDWPMDRPPLVLTPNQKPATELFYRRQAAAQLELMEERVTHDTPKVQIITDPKTGKQLRVALRRRREDAPDDGAGAPPMHN